MKASEMLWMLVKANRVCGYEEAANIYEKAAIEERRKEADEDLIIMEAEIAANA